MVKAKKTAPVEEVVVDPVEPAPEPVKEPKQKRSDKRYRTSSIFWGLAFIFVGVLVLLDNLNVVSVNFGNLWQLWPVLIIGAGVSMLALRGWLSSLVAVVLAVVFMGLGLLVSVENPYFDTKNSTMWGGEVQRTNFSTAVNEKELDLTLHTGAVDMTLGSSENQAGYSAELSSRQLVVRQKSTAVRDDVRYDALETEAANKHWWIGMGMMSNELSLDLTQKTPVSLHIDSGASSLSGDLSGIQLKALTVKAGASSVDLRFGAKLAKQDVTIDAGASSLKLSIPSGVGVRVETDNGLSSTDFGDIAKVSDGVYESTGFSSAETQITIHAKIGVSSFEIKRY